MIFPFLTTIFVCFLEMFPLGRQMSFSSTRPMVISSHSKSSRCVAPPFSVRMMLNGMSEPPAGTDYLERGRRSKREAIKQLRSRKPAPAAREGLVKHGERHRVL